MSRSPIPAGALDGVGTAAGPWLVLGVVLGLLLAGAGGWLVVAARRPGRPSDSAEPPPPPGDWAVDDLPGFLEHPPGVAAGPVPVEELVPVAGPAMTPFADPVAARREPPPASSGARPGRTLAALAAGGVVLVGAAAVVAIVAPDPSVAAGARRQAAEGPSWPVPDLPPVPERPGPDDAGAGLLAPLSVPVGPDGVLARLAFEGVVLEQRAVGVTVSYPAVSLTAAAVPGGPALAHVRLPVWNCLGDAAPADPVAAGCRRTRTEYADLPTPALSVSLDGERLRLTGRFPTYVRPTGSPPEWTGRVYPLAVTVRPAEGAAPAGEGSVPARGELSVGTERAAVREDPRLSVVRRGR